MSLSFHLNKLSRRLLCFAVIPMLFSCSSGGVRPLEPEMQPKGVATTEELQHARAAEERLEQERAMREMESREMASRRRAEGERARMEAEYKAREMMESKALSLPAPMAQPEALSLPAPMPQHEALPPPAPKPQREAIRPPAPKPQRKAVTPPAAKPQGKEAGEARKRAETKGVQSFSEEVSSVLEEVEVKRFPSIESPDEVNGGESISVMVMLTEELLTPSVKITQGKSDEEGRLLLSLPKQPDDQDWPIDVVLSASGFHFDSPNKMTIMLPRAGDSSPALFQLTAKESEVIASQRSLYATFWHKGKYLARVMKPIIVKQAGVQASGGCQANATLSAESRAIFKKSEAANIDASRHASDLTIYMRRDWDSCASTDYFVTVTSPHSATRHERISMPEDIGQWLQPRYRAFSRSGRGTIVGSSAGSASESNRDQLLGFGKLLYEKFAPQIVREAYTELAGRLGSDFVSIQIYTDDPVLPWELMVPQGSDTFLGVKHAVGRWVIPKTASDFTVPKQQLAFKGVSLLAPSYAGDLTLKATEAEVSDISAMQWPLETRRVAGNYLALKQAFQHSEPTIVHYAGHGYASRDESGRATEFGLILEDERLSSLNWRGMLGDKPNPSFVFFNACDVGQAERAAGFVDGWSTTLADSGSVGFISALWELGDEGAAQFSRRFYTDLTSQLSRQSIASVSVAMRSARAAFLESGNPTYLAYVFYGDPELMLKKAGARE